MPNMRELAYKLQTALNMADVPVVISEKRFFSRVYNRPITKYKVKIRWPDRYADQIIETYSAAEMVKALAAKYLEVQEAKEKEQSN